MNVLYTMAALLGVSLLSACDSQKQTTNLRFANPEAGSKIVYGQSVELNLELSKSQQNIDSVVYSLNGSRIGSSKELNPYPISSETLGLGRKTIKASVYAEGQEHTAYSNVTVVGQMPKLYGFNLLNTFPHQTDAFTQGLEFNKGVLYESTGRYEGQSSLRKVDYKTGEVLKKTTLGAQYFAEGITFVNDKIIQLTYRELVAMVYDPKTFNVEKTLKYFKNMEGWGLCYDGTHLIMSDGTHQLHLLNPNDLSLIKTIDVYDQNGPVENLNELEYIDGKVYANVYTKDYIVILDPNTGHVEGKVNLTGINPEIPGYVPDKELNGIAYHPERKTIFVTGKTWGKIFEIELVGK